METQWQDPVVVVGAGIAGLSAAFRLRQAGIPVVVLERNGPQLLGGRMASVERDGCHVDLGAPLLAARYTKMLRLVADAGLAGQVLPASDVVAVAAGAGRVHRGRTGTPRRLLLGGMLAPVPWRDRIRLLADLRGLRHALHPADMTAAAPWDQESVVEYARRRGMHARTLNHLLDPMVGTLCLAEPGNTSAVAPFLFLAFLLRGGGFFTSARGSGFLPQGLAAQLQVVCRTEVIAVEERTGEVRVTYREAGRPETTRSVPAVILAVPPSRLAVLCPQLPPIWRQVAEATGFSRLVQVTFLLDRPTAERAVLVHAPRPECPDIDSLVLQHNFSAHRVPAGGGMITTYLSGAASERWWELDDGRTVDHVLGLLHRTRLLPEAALHCRAVYVDRIFPAVARRPPGNYRVLDSLSASTPPFGRIRWAGGEHLGHSTTIGSLTSGQHAAEGLIASRT